MVTNTKTVSQVYEQVNSLQDWVIQNVGPVDVEVYISDSGAPGLTDNGIILPYLKCLSSVEIPGDVYAKAKNNNQAVLIVAE